MVIPLVTLVRQKEKEYKLPDREKTEKLRQQTKDLLLDLPRNVIARRLYYGESLSTIVEEMVERQNGHVFSMNLQELGEIVDFQYDFPKK